MTSDHETPAWETIRSTIKYLDEGDGAPRAELVTRAANAKGTTEALINNTLDEMERRGAVYCVNGRYKDTNAVLQ